MRVIPIFILLTLLLSFSITVAADDIVLIPENPVAGKNLIFYMPYVNESVNGYVICENNDVHLVEINNGLGQVTFDEDDYGTATVKIYCRNKTYTKTFEVEPFIVGNLVIEAASSVLINTEATVKISAGVTPAEGAMVTFKATSGRSFNRIADVNGNVLVSFDEAGHWEINTEFYGVTALATIQVMLPPIVISFSEGIEVNEEMTISIGDYASITITKDEITWDYQTDANGDLVFTPPWPGKYSVYAKTAKQEGSKTFITISETEINVYDFEKHVPISKIKTGQLVEIVIVDPSNVPISEVDEILVYCDNALWTSLPLSDGSVIWKVDKDATIYRFEFEEIEGYLSSEITVYMLLEESFPLGDIVFYIVLIIIILVVVFVFIRFMKSGRITIPKLFAGKKLGLHHGRKLE